MQKLPTQCETIPYFYSNSILISSLILLFLFVMWTFVSCFRLENICCCCNSKCQILIKEKVTPQCRRYLTSLLILMYSVVVRESLKSINCIDQEGDGRYVQER